jgi:NAD(P)-dependent dehydrogenase (short-subunit alcohol dehydrogenase family)
MSKLTQHAVVVGGTSGIGQAAAKLFAERGYRVTIGGRDRERLEAAAEKLGVSGIQVDGAVQASARGFFEALGPVDHLVLALSGGAGAGLFRTLSLDDLRSGFEAKFWAHLTTLKAALPHLRDGGSVTFVSAISARAALPGTSGLAAINGAIEALVRPLAVELGPIRINAVSPGVIDTPWWNRMPANAKEDFFRGAAESLPVRRVGNPSDVASVIVMLAENSFVTGTVVEVDGGAHLAR